MVGEIVVGNYGDKTVVVKQFKVSITCNICAELNKCLIHF